MPKRNARIPVSREINNAINTWWSDKDIIKNFYKNLILRIASLWQSWNVKRLLNSAKLNLASPNAKWLCQKQTLCITKVHSCKDWLKLRFGKIECQPFQLKAKPLRSKKLRFGKAEWTFNWQWEGSLCQRGVKFLRSTLAEPTFLRSKRFAL